MSSCFQTTVCFRPRVISLLLVSFTVLTCPESCLRDCEASYPQLAFIGIQGNFSSHRPPDFIRSICCAGHRDVAGFSFFLSSGYGSGSWKVWWVWVSPPLCPRAHCPPSTLEDRVWYGHGYPTHSAQIARDSAPFRKPYFCRWV